MFTQELKSAHGL